MFEFPSKLLDTQDFPPRWQCGVWSAELGWLHILSDLAIFGAYLAIPCVIAFYAFRRRDVYFQGLTWLFVLFILSCGVGHLVEASIFWYPWYRLSGLVKFVTAIASWATVVAIIIALPKALTLPGLKSINLKLDREISERQRKEDLFKLVIEASPSGMLLVDGDGIIRFANTFALRCFGYEMAELVGTRVEALVPARLREHHPALRLQYLQNPVSRAMGEGRDLFGVRKDGAEIPVELGLNPIRTSDGLNVLVNVVDITQRKRLEAALRAKNDEMEQLIYIVSHDLRSPLVTIEGFAGMIGEHLEANQFDKATDALCRIKRASGTMTRLIHDVLELSRVGRETVDVAPVNVRGVLDEVAASMVATLQQAQARLVIDGSPESVYADRNQLVQVFMNLIGNAVTHGCPLPGGVVTVGGERRDGEFAFFVKDEGPGVEPEMRERIFKPFQRGDHRRDGAGLGLAIVSKIMERHNGKTWVESAPGGGTSFWITLPANAPLETPQRA